MAMQPVPAGKASRLLNHGPTVLVGSAHAGRVNVMAAAWAMPLDFVPTVIFSGSTAKPFPKSFDQCRSKQVFRMPFTVLMRSLLLGSFLLAGCATSTQPTTKASANRLEVLANGVVLPASVSIKVPAASVGEAARAFSGRWEGGLFFLLACALVVEDVRSDTEATVVFAMSTGDSPKKWRGAWHRMDAVIDGSTMRFKLSDNSNVLFQLNSDETVSAKLPVQTGVSTVLLRKVSDL